MRQAKLGISYRLKSDIGKAEQAAYHQKRIDGGNEIDEATRQEIPERNASECIEPRNY